MVRSTASPLVADMAEELRVRSQRISELEAVIHKLEFVAFASINRGYLREDHQLTEAAGEGLHMAHELLGVDVPERRIFDVRR